MVHCSSDSPARAEAELFRSGRQGRGWVALLRASFGALDVGFRRIEHGQSTHHAIGPAKAILRRILAAAAAPAGVGHVILLHQLSGLAIEVIDAGPPATGDRGGGAPPTIAH